MSENEATSDQDDVSFIRTDDMVCLQCSETGERVCLAAEGFGNRHCFLEPIANKNYPPEMPSCVFVIEQALSVRALQEMVTAETGDSGAAGGPAAGGAPEPAGPVEQAAADELAEGSGEPAAPGGPAAGAGRLVASSSSGGAGNRTLLYGHAVLLRHLHSGMYLATLPSCSSSDKLAFDVGLKQAHELGESCWWTVHPGSKQRSEGEKVRVGDDLILVSVATERYLHYTTSERPLTPPMASASANDTAALNLLLAGKQAIVNASFHSTHWSIAPFGTGLSRAKSVGYVFGGQVLRLLHGGDECLTVAGQQQAASDAGAAPADAPAPAANNPTLQQQADVIYEAGPVMNQARSLWRLDLIRTRWSGGFVQYTNALRIRHITTGKYLGVNERLQLCLLAKLEATVERTAFCLKQTKDDSKSSRASEPNDDKDEEVIGAPTIKYGDSSFFIQHIDSQMWLSYRSYETKRRGIGRVEEKQAILSAEGKMDDCLEFSRSQEEEAKTARVIRKCDALFSKFIKILDHIQLLALAHRPAGQQPAEPADQDLARHTQPRSSISAAQAKRRGSAVSSAVAMASISSLAAPMFHSSAKLLDDCEPAHDQHQQHLSAGGRPEMQPIQQPIQQQQGQLGATGSLFPYESQIEMSKCLEDLIDYFAQPEEGCDHEQEQNRLRALRNRQDLFQEEGILNLILDAIDKINLISGQGLLVLLLGEESSSTWESITGYFYQLLAAIIKDNHTNCAQFAQSHRLNWLFSRLSSQQASEGTGMLDVLHCVLVDSPEALNMLKESHIKVLISLLEKHGRDPKVLNVLCSLCVSNGVAIRSSQNTITNHLLPGRNLLLQTRLADEVASMRPNIYIARIPASAMYHRWYYEVIVDHVELINNLSPHLRVGWANTKGYLPYPGGGSHWGANGVGDDFFSYGFDGQYLWTAGRPTLVRIPPNSTMTRHEVLQEQFVDYQNQHQALLESYASQQNKLVSGQQQGLPDSNVNSQQQQQQQPQPAGLTSLANIDSFTHSPYLRLQKNDVIGCMIDLSVPTIQFTINGKQIFGFFKNFNVNQGGFFHPVISFSAKVSCRFLFGSNQGELHYRPPPGFSPLVDVLLPNQDVCVEPCFSFGDLAKQTVSGPQITPDCAAQMVMDLVFIPKLIDTSNFELNKQLEVLRDHLAENMHELWCMSRIEDGWIYGEEHDEQNQTHPYIAPFSMLPALSKKYKLDLAAQTIKIILGLGYKITGSSSSGANSSSAQQQSGAGMNLQTGQRLKTYRLPNMPYLQSNGYKPAPLDLGSSGAGGEPISPKLNHLVELLAENIHNIWAAEKIGLKWTYKRRDPMMNQDLAFGIMDDGFGNPDEGRSCHLLAYKYVDDEIKQKNRQSALETVLTITTYGYHIEPQGPAAQLMGLDASGRSAAGQDVASGSSADHGNLLSPSPSGQSPQVLAGSRPASVSSGLPLGPGQGQDSLQANQLTGHEVILDNAPEVGLRHYRAEKTYAVQTGRWYYEVEICTLGHIQIGWCNLHFQSNSVSLGCDENSWAFDCHSGRKVHASNHESFGQLASVGDVIGCMLDLNDRTISYSLNGKLMLDYLGNEMAFSGPDLLASSSGGVGATSSHEATSYVPAVSLGVNQRVKLSFGQDVEQLRHFTDYGLQEGYHPFCVNMHKPITLWYNKREANFVNLDELPQQQVNIEVTRIPPGSDSPPALKVAYKQFESQERATWEQLRLSLPVTISSELIDESDKIAKMQEIQAHQLRLAYNQAREAKETRAGAGLAGVGLGAGQSLGGHLLHDQQTVGLRHPARLEQHMLQSGFSLADVKDLQRSYQENQEPGTTLKQQQLQGLRADGGAPGGPMGANFPQLGRQRQQLVKTRSVDHDQRSAQTGTRFAAAPSLAVPSFTEAQRMMANDGHDGQPRGARGLKRRNTGFNLLSRSSSSSLENIANQQNQVGVKTVRSKSTFKSLFGSMKSRAPSEPRSQSLSRGAPSSLAPARQQQPMNVPKISVQNESHFGPGANDSSSSTRFSRPMSRSESYSSLVSAKLAAPDKQDTAPSAGRGLVRRLSRVGAASFGLGGAGHTSAAGSAAGKSGSQSGPAMQQQQLASLPSDSLAGYSDEPASFDLQYLDKQTLDLIDEYYYGVRIFPGQEPAHVLCGWVTSRFKRANLASLQDIQHAQIIQSTSLITGQAEICERRECYLLNAGLLYKETHPTAQGPTSMNASAPGSPGASGNASLLQQSLSASAAGTTPAGDHGGAPLAPNSAAAGATMESSSSRSNRGMLIGCHVDTSTGMLTFTVDGQATKYRFLVEPQTKLYPAIFFQATTGDCLQFELSRTPLALPISAAILSLTPKHVNPQCPPRLKVQTMQSCTWSRVPNVSLRPNSLKLSDSRGWSMLADDPLAMLLVQVPEEDRCLDVLELIEHEKLLRFHSHTLILYGALCAQGNHKVAHVICSYVDQRQLLYAINSDYLSGDLRRGFADLLIALHLEFHAYGRHLTQNEFIVPITQQLCQLYMDANSHQLAAEHQQSYSISPLAHSFSRTECVSIRTEMSMSPIGFDLSSHLDSAQPQSGASRSPTALNATSGGPTSAAVKSLSTPYFPINILKRLVFQALDEAVFKGNLPIRDLPGGSNENLFVPLLKLADKLLLIGCITNQDLNWLLSLIDPETFRRPTSVEETVTSAVSASDSGAQPLVPLVDSHLMSGLGFLAAGANSPSSIWKPTILEQPKRLQQQHHGFMNGCCGLLQMRKLDEHVKLIICHILHHLLDIQLRHRIESIMAFSVNFVGQLQLDQRRRYNEIKTSNLPSHLTARKTREFRCTPKEQMRYILNFKNNAETDDLNSSPSSETLRQTLKQLHSSMMKQIKVIIESSTMDDEDDGGQSSNADQSGDDYYARQRILSSYADQNFHNPMGRTKHQAGANGLLLGSFKKLLLVLKLVKATLMSQEFHFDALNDGSGGASGQGAAGFGLVGQIELKFVKNIVKTIVKWAEESSIDNKQLVRQMFHLLLRCYNGVGELIEALNNSYVIGERSKQDVVDLLRVLSKVRALLAVQMGPAEEEVMRDCLWTLVNNVVFFQHPDLIRILRVHENVMHVMMNTLSKRSRAQGAAPASVGGAGQPDPLGAGQQPASQSRQQRTQSIPGLCPQQQQSSDGHSILDQQQQVSGQGGAGQLEEQQDDISKMVVSCCRFLCFFCRSSAKNQKAMFEHLGFLLENSNILLSRPSLRGSTPLDVAYSSLMENHELVLALRESYLEKIAIYLSRCGLQSNQELIDKGYPDVGWDPVEGERYLDFLRFCVWVNGESVEENSNLVIRLLIRRPECLGPALRGEGPGLFAAIKDAIAMADRIHAEQQELKREQQLEQQTGPLSEESPGDDEDEDEINMGSAILNFYCALVDLLGRCAPDLQTIGQGKHESIRARSILKSLVPIQDLKSAISLKFALVSPQYAQVGDNEMPFGSTAASFMPNHKQSLVLFLERVYGIEDQETFFSLLEEAFLPDMRAATMLERCLAPTQTQTNGSTLGAGQLAGASSAAFLAPGPLDQGQTSSNEGGSSDEDTPENEMTLALNRYLGNSAIPLLIRESHYFKNAENYANLLEPTLHTVYRLSKVKILTKGQRESVSDFLIALTREMQPHQLLKLLRKLTVDVATLNESTTVALRLLTLHYERCSKYYGYTGNAQTSASGVYGTATEEERRLTMVLFTNIFDSLSLMDYDPELFENALPCLNALACALPPDYSLTESRDQLQLAGSASGGFKSAGAGAKASKQQQSQASAAAAAAAAAATQSVGPYVPQPVSTQTISLDQDLRQLARRFSEHFHDAWASRKLDRDWTYGEQYNFKNKTHPRLKPYWLLTQHERDRYIEPIEEAIKALLAMGWSIERPATVVGSLAHQDPQQGSSLSRSNSRLDLQSVSSGSSAAKSPSGRQQAHTGSGQQLDLAQWREAIQNYNPQPVDTSNLSLSRELQNLVERSAENAHDLWAKRTMEDWELKLRSTSRDYLRAPIMLHPMMVPYDLLTDKERRKNRDRSQELLKYILFEGYRICRFDEQQHQQQIGAASQQQQASRGRINSRAGTESNVELGGSRVSASSKRRFAYSILDKLLAYTDTVMVKLELWKPSSNFSRRSSFKQSDRDVKFFSKVVLPLIERYFNAHREFFLNYYSLQAGGSSASSTAPSGSAEPLASGQSAPSASPTGSSGNNNMNLGGQVSHLDDTQAVASGNLAELAAEAAPFASGAAVQGSTGFATIAEKEMLANLFCKLASVLRNKLSVIGPDAKIFVRCLQVLTRCLDARSLSEQSPDFIKTSMLTYFNKTAQDLSQCVYNLQMKRYNAVRGTTMRTSSSLYHVHLAILPTLTALFDHLASSETGKYLLLDEIQLASQRIFQNLYILGTRIQLAGKHQYSRKELERHRHSYGNCQAAFAAAFPIAFLEPELIRFNRFSAANTRRLNQLQAAHHSGGPNQPAPVGALASSGSRGRGARQARHDDAAAAAALDEQQQRAALVQLQLDSMPALPRLEELLATVTKFVQTGRGPTSELGGLAVPVHLPEPQAGARRNQLAGPNGLGALGELGGPANMAAGLAGHHQQQAQHQQLNQQQMMAGANQAAGQLNNMALAGANVGGAAAPPAAHNQQARLGGRGPAGPQRMIPADNDAAIIEVIVPLLCSYLPFWYLQGPEASAAARASGAGSGSTNVGASHLNDLLHDIMMLIKRQVGVESMANGANGANSVQFNWMVAIAAHASQIIIDTPESSILSESFLSLSTKISERAECIYHREELMRGYLKSTAEDTTAIEERIQEEFHVLVRDIYAFYPLLIKYVDFKKSTWLKPQGLLVKQVRKQAIKAAPDQLKGSDSGALSLLDQQQQQQPRLPVQSKAKEQDNQPDEAEPGNPSNKPEQLLFHQVATVFDIWSNSQYFRREEQNFISLHEIDNMALIMQASNRPGRIFFQKSDPTQGSASGRKKRRRGGGASEKRDREREIASSLLVVALKRLLPVGMNLFEGRERELVQHVKERFLKKDPQGRIEELVKFQLTQPYKIDPSDEFCWQHYLYSRLGAQSPYPSLSGGQRRNKVHARQDSTELYDDSSALSLESGRPTLNGSTHGNRLKRQLTMGTSEFADNTVAPTVDGRLVARIVDMARVFHGLHIIDHPNLQQKAGRRSCVSTQRRRVVIACFRMTSLHSLPKHRAINIFLRSYCDTWLLDENLGQEKLIEDLTQTFEQAEMKTNGGDLGSIPRNDPLSQLIMTLSRQATTEHGSMAQSMEGGGASGRVDRLYLQFADIFRMSCGGDEEEEDEDEDAAEEPAEGETSAAAEVGPDADHKAGEPTEEDKGAGEQTDRGSTSSIHEQEIEKQRLLFQQSRLSNRGVAEMILLYISAFSRQQSGSSGSGVVVGAVSGGSASGGASVGAASGSGSSHSLSELTPIILSTLKLGISILRGGNVEVQRRMLKHLKDKRDVGFFTSIQMLMNSCSVLDLDAFERNQKAEALGVRSEGPASEKNMYDAEFTCKLFRFFQLLCEGHNLEFQNYLRTQVGNTTTVNVVISTVDYLLRLQESIMDFYWHYSSKEVIDPSGTENFIKAITIAKQVFCTLTESIQGPCPQNQQALAHSRLWHAVGGFLFLFAHMQDKLSRNSSQLNLLIELLDLQKEMVIMMLSMLEGNVVNGTIGKQMVETLVESSGNVEIILKFFDMFLKLPRLTSSSNFQEYDRTGSGWISLADLKRAMEQQKIYTAEETQYLLSCCEPNHDGMIDYREFIDRFHQPAKDIGFNLAVLLTNLAEHITNEPRLQRFLETASTVLNYFEPYLGRIEIMGSSKRIERVYFEIKESTLDQWAKPQIQESKRAFFYSIVTEGEGKEKLEAFVNFCEDTIFEMQHASNILGEDAEEPPTKADKYPFDASAGGGSGSSATAGSGGDTGAGPGGSSSTLAGADRRGMAGFGSASESHSTSDPATRMNRTLWSTLIRDTFWHLIGFLTMVFNQLRPSRLRRRWWMLKRMSYGQLFMCFWRLVFKFCFGTCKITVLSIYSVAKFIFHIMTGDSSLIQIQDGGHAGQPQHQHRSIALGQRGARNGSPSLQANLHDDRDVSKSNGLSSGANVTGRPEGVAGASSLVRTELVTAPSIMRASVAEVGQQLEARASDVHQQMRASDASKYRRSDIRSSSDPMNPSDQSVLFDELELTDDPAGLLAAPSGAPKGHKSKGLLYRLLRLTSYNQKIISFLARNFYRIKLLALVTAFIINFILLFYKVTEWTSDILELTSSENSFLSVARKTIGEVSSNAHIGSTQADEAGRSLRTRLDEIEAKLKKSFATYEKIHGHKLDDDDGDGDEGDQEDEDDMNDVEGNVDELEDHDVVDVDDVSSLRRNHVGDELRTNDTQENQVKSSEQRDTDKELGKPEDEHKDSGADETDADENEETDLVEWVIMEEKYYYLQPILTFLASIHSIFSLCMLIAYYHLKVPLVIFKREKEIARKLEFEGVYITEEPDSDNWWTGYWDRLVISAASFPVNYWDKFVKKRVREKYREQYDYEQLSNLLGMDSHGSGGSANQQSKDTFLGQLGLTHSSLFKVDWRYQLWKAGVTLTDQSFQYQLLYLIFSVAGHFNSFFFAAHLLDVAVGFKKLQTILQSVTHNGKQLVLTVMLLTIVVYIYTVIAFNFFRKFYVQGEDSPERKCHSMMTCFVYHLYQGVRAGGGIGDVIEAPDGDDYEVYRIIFDITFFFFVIVILLAIIQGLIIDAFGELRDQLLTVASDMESNCFICGIGKDVLDKVPRGFDTHVQKEHNLANYMFFLMHLINKPDTDYTGQETYVWELYQRRCWDFFPVGECFRTQSEEEADSKPAKD